MPDEPQREEIIKIHLKKLERPDLFNAEQMKQLAQASDKFSGAALQTWVQAAVNYAFINGKDEVGIQDFLDTVGEVAITDEKEKNITRAMEWARKNRARMASKSAEKKVGPEVTGERKLNLKLAGGLKVKDVPKAGDNAPQA